MFGYEWNIDVDDDNNIDINVNVDFCFSWFYIGELIECIIDVDCFDVYHCEYCVKGDGVGVECVWKA